MKKQKKNFLTSIELSKKIGLSRCQIAALIRKNIIKASKIGRSWIIYNEEVGKVKRRRSPNKKDIV